MRNEYPRPNFKREEWLSLNGKWDFSAEGTDSQIEVPFVCQSQLSGVNRRIKSDYVTYHRTLQVPASWKGKRILLNFGAVDYRATVLLNGSCVAEHEGGNSPFSVDVTRFLTWETEDLTVEVYDPLTDETIPRGKQSWRGQSEFIWYTPSTGIWQSVWLEPVEQTHWEMLHFTPNLDKGTVEITWRLSEKAQLPCRCSFRIAMEDKVYFEGGVGIQRREGTLTVDLFQNKHFNGFFHFGGLCWSPEQPKLFDVTAKLYTGDQLQDTVETYFGMRKIEIRNGKVYLNNYIYYQKLVLDQGYWRTGLLTAPDDQSYADDIRYAKEFGFNGCRKHEKAEDPRFLYWADKLGFLVWGSMSSFVSYKETAVRRFMNEWQAIIERDYNHPCIVLWNMLNESWGVPDVARDVQQQQFARTVYAMAKAVDQTRLVADIDGWEQTESDLCTLHSYSHGEENDTAQKALFAECLNNRELLLSGAIMDHTPYANGYGYTGAPIVLSEFGGITMDSDRDSWGYSQANTEEEFVQAYERLIDAIYASRFLCGFCYTELTDVEQEKNGLLDFDHKPKLDPAKIRAIHEKFHY